MKSLLAALALTLVPVKYTEPRLKRFDGGRYVVANPLLVPVEVTIDCGQEYEKLTVKVAAGVQEDLLIRTPNGSPGICYLDSWKPL